MNLLCTPGWNFGPLKGYKHCAELAIVGYAELRRTYEP
jgi:hypothetical protein